MPTSRHDIDIDIDDNGAEPHAASSPMMMTTTATTTTTMMTSSWPPMAVRRKAANDSEDDDDVDDVAVASPQPQASQQLQPTSAVELVRRYIESLPEHVPFRKEIRNVDFWRALWAEFLVTLLFLVVGCGAEVKWTTAPRSAASPSSSSTSTPTTTTSAAATSTDHQPTHLTPNVTCASSSTAAQSSSQAHSTHAADGGCAARSMNIKAALAMGLTVTSLVHSTAHVSGCHLNPAVSIGLFVTRNISPLRTVAYVLVQCLGATVGAALLYGLTPPQVRLDGLVTTALHPDVHPSQAFGVELLVTLIVTITLMASWDQPNATATAPAAVGCKALIIGLAYTVGHLFAYPYTGAGMNPARSLALALVTNSWKYHWVYWAGPILGGILGGFTYEYIRDSKASAYQMYNYGRPQSRPEVNSRQPPCWQQTRSRHHRCYHRESRDGMKRDQSGLSHLADTELSIATNDYHI